jgi:serine/threonine-protein kinase
LTTPLASALVASSSALISPVSASTTVESDISKTASTSAELGNYSTTSAATGLKTPSASSDTTSTLNSATIVLKTSTSTAPKSTATIVSTFAGGNYASDADGYGTAARFFYLSGIAFRKSDNMTFVVDGGVGGIRTINSSGYVSTYVLRGSTVIDGNLSIARFKSPYFIAVDDIGTIFVSEYPSLLRTIKNGIVSTYAGNASTTIARDGFGTNAVFDGLTCITSDGNGNLYTTERKGRIRKIDINGNVTTLADSSGFGNTVGAGIDAQFYYPRGIVFDNKTNLIYIADSDYNVIKSMDVTGYVRFVAGSQTGEYGFVDGNSTTARFSGPKGIALDGKGNLIIADNSNYAIRRLDLTSFEVSTIAGTGEYGSFNGYGNESTFCNPQDVAIDQDGSILVTDSDYYLIRKIKFVGI